MDSFFFVIEKRFRDNFIGLAIETKETGIGQIADLFANVVVVKATNFN
jgi:hypothetical protein